MVEFGKFLEKLRKDAGLSYRRLGAAVGISHNNLVGYEHNTFGASFTNVVALAKFFNVPLEYFLSGEKGEYKYQDLELLELFGELDDFPDDLRSLTKDYIKRVLEHGRERQELAEQSQDPFGSTKRVQKKTKKP